jgi:acetolactate synthase-1/2/3 large subunit
MGFGLPAAIGASMYGGDGAKQVVLLAGDGGFQMSMQELSTVKKAKKPIKIFIFDNSALRMIVNKQNALYDGNCVDSRLSDNPDFALIAEAYGIDHVTLDVSGRESVKQKIAEILSSDSHTIVCCKV